MWRRDPKLLFQGGDLAGLFADRFDEVKAEVDAANEDQLLQVDEQAWAASLAERYRLQAPVLRADTWSMEKKAIQQHRQVVSLRSAGGETGFRATMRWPGDDERLADLNVFLFETPAAVSDNGSEG